VKTITQLVPHPSQKHSSMMEHGGIVVVGIRLRGGGKGRPVRHTVAPENEQRARIDIAQHPPSLRRVLKGGYGGYL
jgi:hypothetical protein